ncbi:MAG: LLM class flavin-dependent oxidoreductase [Candidatus Caldarchaeum sp.]
MNTVLSIRLNSDLCDSRTAVKLSELCENTGFDGFWYCEDLFKRDAWVVLSAAAASTSLIKLGTAIVNPFSSNVVEIAMRAATLAELSGGRFCLGIGVGAPETLRWAGLNVDKPLQGLYAAVDKLRKLLDNGTGPPNALTFKVSHKIPIYIGGQGRKTVEAIGRIGDGGLPLIIPPESAQKFLPIIHEGARKVGRDVSSIDISACLWYYVAETKEELNSCRKLRELIAYYGPLLSEEVLNTAGLSRQDFTSIAKLVAEQLIDEAIELVTPKMFNLAITSTYDEPQKILHRFRELMRMGVKHFNIGPPLGEDLGKAIEFTGRVLGGLKTGL